MTQQEPAGRVGRIRQTIIVLEEERYLPSLSLAFPIAGVFGKTIEEMFECSYDKWPPAGWDYAFVAMFSLSCLSALASPPSPFCSCLSVVPFAMRPRRFRV